MGSGSRLEEVKERLAQIPDPVELLEGLFAYSPVGYQIYKADGHCLLTNQAFRDLFGSEPPPEYNVLEDDIAKATGIIDLIHRAFAGETISTPPVWYDPRELKQVKVTEGRRVAMTATFFPLHDRAGQVAYVAIAFRDVTAEVLAREQAERTAALLDTIIGKAPIGLAFLDPELRYVRINEELARFHGLPAHAHVGRKVREIVPDLAGEVEPILRDVLASGESRLGVEIGGDGHGRKYLVSYFPVRTGDELIGVGAVAEDVTEQRADEARLAALLASEQEARARAEALAEDIGRALRARDDFLTIAGHELKTPVAALQLVIDGLKRHAERDGFVGKTDVLVERIGKLAHNVARLSTLVRSVLDVGKLAGGRLALDLVDVDLGALTSDVADRFTEELERSGCALSLVAPRGIVGRWDRVRLEQVLTNLLSNAVKYGAGKPIEITVERTATSALVRVRDHGIGVPPDDIERIFGRFERAVSEQHYGGLGLGLWISRRIVEAHGGAIRVESEPNVRTTFTIELPV